MGLSHYEIRFQRKDIYVLTLLKFQSKLSLAHRIKQGVQSEKFIYKYMIEHYNLDLSNKQIKQIIHHPENLVVACRGACNDSFNIFYKPVERNELLEKIIDKLNLI